MWKIFFSPHALTGREHQKTLTKYREKKTWQAFRKEKKLMIAKSCFDDHEFIKLSHQVIKLSQQAKTTKWSMPADE